MYRVKRFSRSGKDSAPTSDSEVMIGIGKTGLGVAGVAATGAAIETGLGAKSGIESYKEFKKLKKLRKNPEVRNAIKASIKEITPHHSDKIIDTVRRGEKYFPKISGVDKVQRGLSFANSLSNQSRTTLNNADRYATLAIDHIKSSNKGKLGPEALRQLDKSTEFVNKLARTGTRLKNAKVLGKTALIASQIGGLSYYNGRVLQETKRARSGK